MSLVRITLVFLLCLAAAGCGGPSTPDRDWSTLVRVLTQNPTTLDPAQVKDVAGGRIVAHVFGTLVACDNESRFVGDVAESWTVSDDGRVYAFRVRPGLKFANGRAVTPEDVAWSFERTLAPATRSPRTWVLDRIRGARDVMDGKTEHLAGLRVSGDTLTVELDEPFAPFLGLLTMPAAAVVPREVTDFGAGAFGSGPFRVAEFRPNERLVLDRNPHYPGPGPFVERVAWKIIEPPIARLTEFRRGLIDVMEVPGDYVESMTTDPLWRGLLVRTPAFNSYYLGINCTSERFADARARRAIACAIDRAGLVNAIYAGRATTAAGPLPPGIPGGGLPVRGIPFDMARAKALLAEAKFDLSRPVRFLCGSGTDTVLICQALEGALRDLGLTVELMPRESGSFKQALRNGDFDVYYYSWWADYPDAENFLTPLFATSPDRGGANPTGYSNAEVDALIRESQREPDAAKRAALYARIQQIVVDDCPRVWLWHLDEVTVRQRWVAGYAPSPVYNTERGNLIRLIPPEK